MFSSVGPMELIIVLVIALVVLGPKRLPEAGKSLGQGLRSFKESLEGKGDDHDELEAKHEAAPPRSPSSTGSAAE